MYAKQVFIMAQPLLEGKRIEDLVIGLGLIAVELDNGSIGISYVLREQIPKECSSFPQGLRLCGEEADKIGQWVYTGENVLQRAIGLAVVNAAKGDVSFPLDDDKSTCLGLTNLEQSTVGMIGYIPPIAQYLQSNAKKLIVFDQGLAEQGNHTKGISSMQQQEEILPTCDNLILSGTTFLNGTLPYLLNLCPHAKNIILVGTSTPLYPEVFQQTSITALAGTQWNPFNKEEIFTSISKGAGIQQLKSYMVKLLIPILK